MCQNQAEFYMGHCRPNISDAADAVKWWLNKKHRLIIMTFKNGKKILILLFLLKKYSS